MDNLVYTVYILDKHRRGYKVYFMNFTEYFDHINLHYPDINKKECLEFWNNAS